MFGPPHFTMASPGPLKRDSTLPAAFHVTEPFDVARAGILSDHRFSNGCFLDMDQSKANTKPLPPLVIGSLHGLPRGGAS